MIVVIISLFYLSLVTIIMMVGWKLFSLRTLKVSLVEGVENELHSRFYELAHEVWHNFLVTYLIRARAFLLSVLYTIAAEMLRVVGIWGAKLKERHSKWFDMVEGKGVIRKDSSASFFLRDVAEYKKSLGKKQK